MSRPLTLERHEEPVEVEELAPDLVRVPLRTATLPPATRTNSYLVDTGMGWLVVDAGSADPAELERLAQAMHRWAQGDLLGLLLTHHHSDHSAGAHALAERFELPIWMHERAQARLLEERPDWAELDWQLLDDDGAFGEELHVLVTEGHAPGHLAMLLPSGDLLAGDVIAGMGTIVVAPPDGSMSAYLQTLERLIALAPRRVFPAHGPGSEDGTGRLREYLEHRLSRERQVAEALRQGRAPLAELTRRAYPDVPEAMLPYAEWQCLAHLQRFEELGTAELVAGSWCPR